MYFGFIFIMFDDLRHPIQLRVQKRVHIEIFGRLWPNGFLSSLNTNRLFDDAQDRQPDDADDTYEILFKFQK